jgi:hypothetical protein
MESGMPFLPNKDILTLPIDLHSHDFPSITRINDRITMDSLHCDLNHLIPSYRTLAQITLANWTCSINKCANPLNSEGLNPNFSLHIRRISYSWIIAQRAMSSMSPKLVLKCTKLSGILSGKVSLSHILHTFQNHTPTVTSPNGHVLRSLRAKGIRQLKHMGQW